LGYPMLNISTRNFLYALQLSSVFVVIYLVISLLMPRLVNPWRDRRNIKQRLRADKLFNLGRAKIFKEDFSDEQNYVSAWLEKFFGRPKINSLRRHLLQADIYLSVERFLSIWIFLGGLGISMMFFFPHLLAKLGGLAVIFLPLWYLLYKKKQKVKQIEQQMPDAMELLARSLRAGHTLASAAELAGMEVPHPLGTEFRLAYEEQRLGFSITEAFQRMADRNTSKDLQYFVAAVMIQHEAGGNIAELMENISKLIRSRLNLKAKTQALTAQMRLSASLVTVLPIVIFLLIYKINTNYVRTFLNDPIGYNLILMGIAFLVIGNLWLRKLANLEV
jgi:tight adherence protein B